MRAQARGPDFYTALAAALAKLKTRLRRSHDHRQVHHGHRTPTLVTEATGTLGLQTISTASSTTNDDRPQRQRESGDVEDPGHTVREGTLRRTNDRKPGPLPEGTAQLH